MLNTHNFTLIEIIIASVMLVIAVIGSSSFFFANRRNLRSAQLRRSATWAAIDKMEELKSLSFDLLHEKDNSDKPEDEREIGLLDNHSAIRTVEVEDYNDRLKKVTVTVQWNDSSKRFVTYIADY